MTQPQDKTLRYVGPKSTTLLDACNWVDAEGNNREPKAFDVVRFDPGSDFPVGQLPSGVRAEPVMLFLGPLPVPSQTRFRLLPDPK